MAIQRIPLANSLYLAMLAQERQDQERRTLKEQQDLDRRDRNMRDTQDYILRQQDQKLGHQRAMEELALKKRAQLMQERIEQAGLMERRRQQDDAAMQRTLVGQRGRNLDREQRRAAAEATAAYRTRRLGQTAADRRQRRQAQESYRAQNIALTGAYRNVQAKKDDLNSIVQQIRANQGVMNQADKDRLSLLAEEARTALRNAQRDYQQAMIGFTGQHAPHLLPSPMGSGFDDAVGDQGDGTGGDVALDEILGAMRP